jgi:hypothetical protein
MASASTDIASVIEPHLNVSIAHSNVIYGIASALADIASVIEPHLNVSVAHSNVIYDIASALADIASVSADIASVMRSPSLQP